jgi:hypothetical protein
MAERKTRGRTKSTQPLLLGSVCIQCTQKDDGEDKDENEVTRVQMRNRWCRGI